jgi:SOS-response transcriptional repressor LexA
MHEKKMTQMELAKVSSVSQATISRWLKNENQPDSGKLRKICQALEVSEQEAFLAAGIICHEIHELDDDEVLIPILSAKVPCGVPDSDFDSYAVGYEKFNQALLQTRVKSYIPEGCRLYIVHAKGDSMVGKGIVENDLVVFSPDLAVHSGDIGIVEVDDQGLCIKQIVFQTDAVLLKSANPQYDTIVIVNRPVRILGKVIMHVGYL